VGSATSQADHTQSSAGDQETMQGKRAVETIDPFQPAHADEVRTFALRSTEVPQEPGTGEVALHSRDQDTKRQLG